MHVYLEKHAVAFILTWQLMLSVCVGVFAGVKMLVELRMNREDPVALAVAVASMGCAAGVVSLAALGMVDMLLLPPAFALIRFAYSLM